mgnify:CR=1 FL=1
MNIWLLVITDGRLGCLNRTMQAAEANLSGPFSHVLMVNDSGSIYYKSQLERIFSRFQGLSINMSHNDRRMGFCRTYARAWSLIPKDVDYIFLLEDDFVILEPISLSDLASVLCDNPHLSQIALVRQPWNAEEVAAGGIVQRFPAEQWKQKIFFGLCWYEHDMWFTTNPCLIPRWAIDHWVAEPPRCEERFWQALKAVRPDVRSAFWGRTTDRFRVMHIGTERIGFGY